MLSSCDRTNYAPQGHQDPPLLVAHRGASEAAPENTIPAVEKAWELGADAVELDVRVTKDDRMVVIHDRSTERTTGRKLMVENVPYDSIAELDAGSWFDARFEGTRIPLLKEVMDHVPADRELLIEIKSGPHAVGLFEELLEEREAIPAFSIISFDRKVVKKAKERFPKIPAYWVLGKAGKLERTIRKAKQVGVNGLDLHHLNYGPKSTERIRKAGLHALAWTVNDTSRAKELLGMKVGSLTSDRVGKLLHAVR